MTETVWLSVAPQEPGLTSFYRMGDRAVPAVIRGTMQCSTGEGGNSTRNYGQAASVLRQFGLGSGGLYPLEMVRYDRVTPVDGFFWALNFGEKKDALGIEQCHNIRGHTQHGFRPESTVRDEDIVVTRSALDGSDIWGDVQSRDSFFVSPRLGQALHKAGFAKAFHLLRCRVV